MEKQILFRQIPLEKEKKLRKETETWSVKEEDLSHTKQFEILFSDESSSYKRCLISHIRNKLTSYKQQDIMKKKFNTDDFIKLTQVLELLKESELKCHYCSDEVFILYEKVRESKQWSLDRINNDIGHNIGNLVISCLFCNLKRRRTNKDAFHFTKNMVIKKIE
jgi:hypothetical protein